MRFGEGKRIPEKSEEKKRSVEGGWKVPSLKRGQRRRILKKRGREERLA